MKRLLFALLLLPMLAQGQAIGIPNQLRTLNAAEYAATCNTTRFAWYAAGPFTVRCVAGVWTAISTAPSGAAGGSLTGTYPNPGLNFNGTTTGTVGVDKGGTGNGGFTSNGILLGNGTSALNVTAALTTGQVLVGTAGAPAGAYLIPAIVRPVRGVCTVAVASLAAFTVNACDDLTFIAGQRVYLANQASKSANGPYVVGTVGAGVAALTRPLDFAAASTTPSGSMFVVSEGTLFANTTWKITTAGTITVDTTAFDAYPDKVSQVVSLSSGIATIANVPVRTNTGGSSVSIVRVNANTTAATIMYDATGVTPGIVGTASVGIEAAVAAGTTNALDQSTLLVTITN